MRTASLRSDYRPNTSESPTTRLTPDDVGRALAPVRKGFLHCIRVRFKLWEQRWRVRYDATEAVERRARLAASKLHQDVRAIMARLGDSAPTMPEGEYLALSNQLKTFYDMLPEPDAVATVDVDDEPPPEVVEAQMQEQEVLMAQADEAGEAGEAAVEPMEEDGVGQEWEAVRPEA